MLACKKCRHELAERIAQQSMCEIEAALMERNSPIVARRKARSSGPLCDACLAAWQQKYKDDFRPDLACDTRSQAIKRLDEACLRLVPQEV